MLNIENSPLISILKPMFMNESTGHDWYHIERVHQLAIHIAKYEGGNRRIISAAALLHDISDHKFNGGDYSLGTKKASEILSRLDYTPTEIDEISSIVGSISFKGNKVKPEPLKLEGQIVQDADRLDALGAIGIARTFAYGGHINQPIYDPSVLPQVHATKEEYLNQRTHTINHFYEKLLLLKDRMNTSTAKEIATKRHRVLENFLEEFFNEWNCII